MNVIYLATPYSHPEQAVRELRYEMVTEYAARMMRAGLHVYSPISHTHRAADYGLPKETDWWLQYDFEFLDHCRALWVLLLPGWDQSRGVAAEVARAEERGIPILYVRFDHAIHHVGPTH